MTEQPRQNGFYFVTYAGKPIIAEYNKIDPDHNWRIPGQAGKFCDCDFTDIGAETISKESYDLAIAGNYMLDSFGKAAKALDRFMKLNRR